MAKTQSKSKSAIADAIYPKIEKSLKDKSILNEYKSDLDRFLADNTDIYFTSLGPSSKRPIFSEARADKYMSLLGVTSSEVDSAIKSSKNVKSSWTMVNPYNISNALATSYFIKTKNSQYLELTMGYLIVKLYPVLHFEYFRHGLNEACMDYTINNLSQRYNVKRVGSLWELMMTATQGAVELYRDKLDDCTDIVLSDYLYAVHTRMNSLMRNISSQYYDNFQNRRFMKVEHESFEEDSYYEADSNSYAIERITNKVVTHMVINGPDAKLVELSANMNRVSVAELRNYTDLMITEKHMEEIRQVVEAILFLYLFNDDGELHSPDQIGTNDFMVYCLQTYRRSNTTDKNVVKIKNILDKWLDDLGLTKKTGRTATIISFRKALFTFFAMTIQKYA